MNILLRFNDAIPARIRDVLLAVAFGCVAFVSLWPRQYIDRNVAPEVQAKDFLIHACCYLLLSACFAWARGRVDAPWKSRLRIALVCAAFGLAMECLQETPFVNRTFQWGDIVQNLVGSLAGALAMPTVLWRGRRRAP